MPAAPERASVLGVPHGFAVSLHVWRDHGVLAGLHAVGSVVAACGVPASPPLLALATLHDCRAVPVSLQPAAQLLAAASHLQSLRVAGCPEVLQARPRAAALRQLGWPPARCQACCTATSASARVRAHGLT